MSFVAHKPSVLSLKLEFFKQFFNLDDAIVSVPKAQIFLVHVLMEWTNWFQKMERFDLFFFQTNLRDFIHLSHKRKHTTDIHHTSQPKKQMVSVEEEENSNELPPLLPIEENQK